MTNTQSRRRPFLPPRWFIRLAWKVHRGIYRATGERRGLWLPRPGHEGMMRLTTVGRRSGQERSVILAYLQEGQDVFTLAMNGWGAPEPAWWLNLQAHPQATVRFADGTREVVAHTAAGAERDRLWDRWRELNQDLDDYASRRPTETAVVVLSPAADV
jgi:F420H(2)-dependent quinone reductase